jgi:predicted ATP-grasp superfamily ATP-dependent carboligase
MHSPQPRSGAKTDAVERRGWSDPPRSVTVFDADIPPGVAFIRSLARAGVSVLVCVSMLATAGRFSQHTSNIRRCPPVRRTDEFVGWLRDEFSRGSIDLVAPTSDYVSFCVAEALEDLGRKPPEVGHPDAAATRVSLFKDAFGAAMEGVGFPTPEWAAPTSLDEAHEAAERMGYPVVLKPRTHAGVGTIRGSVARSPDELALDFEPYRLAKGNTSVLARDLDVALPIVQRYHDLGTVDVVSLTGCLDVDGSLLALGHCRKMSQSPRRLGVGTMFEPVPEPPFAEAAVDAIREVLGSGLFELEVLVDRTTGEYWAIDLNPRAFGQISLDIALGNDLPRLWYESVTGTTLPVAAPMDPAPEFWHDTASTYMGFAVRLVRGPHRGAILDHAVDRLRTPRVGAIFDRKDPLPGLVYGLRLLRHPRAFIRPLLADIEVPGAPSSVAPDPPVPHSSQ